MQKVNGKNLAVTRMMQRGKAGDARLKYMHVSPKGTTVFGPSYMVRVSLPEVDTVTPSAIYPHAQIENFRKQGMPIEPVELPKGQPAVTSPEFTVPRTDTIVPNASDTTCTFTCNAELLREMLQIVCDVCEDRFKTVRLRICKNKGVLRVDAHANTGKQEFLGVLREIDYSGPYIPGDANVTDEPQAEVKPKEKYLMMKVTTGRKFRG